MVEMMSHDGVEAKQVVDVSLSGDLVQQARLYTRDLSSTLEAFLAQFIARERTQRSEDDAALARVVAALDAFHVEHGLLSDEFGAL